MGWKLPTSTGEFTGISSINMGFLFFFHVFSSLSGWTCWPQLGDEDRQARGLVSWLHLFQDQILHQLRWWISEFHIPHWFFPGSDHPTARKKPTENHFFQQQYWMYFGRIWAEKNGWFHDFSAQVSSPSSCLGRQMGRRSWKWFTRHDMRNSMPSECWLP